MDIKIFMPGFFQKKIKYEKLEKDNKHFKKSKSIESIVFFFNISECKFQELLLQIRSSTILSVLI